MKVDTGSDPRSELSRAHGTDGPRRPHSPSKTNSAQTHEKRGECSVWNPCHPSPTTHPHLGQKSQVKCFLLALWSKLSKRHCSLTTAQGE